MKTIALTGNVILPDEVLAGGVVLIEDDTIVGVYYNDNNLPESDIDFRRHGDLWISPGLIDTHVHGALGRDVMDADPDGLRDIARHQARCGVTGFLPTTMTASLDAVGRAVEAVKLAAAQPMDSDILGVHLEGPFINGSRKGAQDPAAVIEITRESLDRVYGMTAGLKTVITLAPEAGENLSFIPEMVERGLVVSLGHSDALYEEGLAAIDAGANRAAHLFNAWGELKHREPGGLGAVLDSKRVYAELIVDGIHVHPSILRLAIAAKGKEKICLVTDSLKVAGLADGSYSWLDREIVLKDQEARLGEGGALAGSVLRLNEGVKNILDWTDAEVWEAVNMASLNPARSLGLDETIGSLAEGKKADIVVFDSDFRVIETWLRGRRIEF
jgi:N-acetylglucosamine-6-phosphate deacetylase